MEQLEQIARAAVDAEKATGCPAELTTAQCILESGWLKHAPGNNCFGIKAYSGCQDTQLLRTTEWFTDAEVARFLRPPAQGRTATLKHPEVPARKDGRREYAVQDLFAAFKTLGDCFTKRAAMWDKARYAKAAAAFKQGGGLEDLVRGIAPIYATDPGYADKVLGLINRADVRAALKGARA